MTGAESVVIGAGIWGCTIARRLAESGRHVRVLEKRLDVGGNVHCEIDPDTGIEIHLYGSHIFHTHDAEVWDFVRRFTDFNGYQHKVLAEYRGKTYHLPLGLTLVNKFFGVELKPAEVKDFLSDPVRKAQLFDAFFRGYTSKQWGKAPEEIDPEVIKRVPVRDNYDTNYFNDCWQGIPSDGYNAMFKRMLSHQNISVETGRDVTLAEVRQWVRDGIRVFYSGPLDRLFEYKYGALPWRSLRFECETLPIADFQGTAVVNYTEAEVPYTRIHEFRHYHPEGRLTSVSGGSAWGWDQGKTVIMREYPRTWKMGDEPYYPIVNSASAELLAKYQAEVTALNAQVAVSTSASQLVVGGRLGQYKYYDMDQAVAAALAVGI